MNMERVLQAMAEKAASDLFISANAPLLMKLNGQMVAVTNRVLAPQEPHELLAEVLTKDQMTLLEREGELNVALSLVGVGYFRLSAFRQRGSLAAVLRRIPSQIPDITTLHVPATLHNLALEKRGLVLMVGATGTGKSTTLAAMLEWRNQQMPGHILTLEDPIEFLFTNKRSVVNQREVGRDTVSLHVGLKNALRQAPDCILIGEIRDRETMSAAISYALSGHLVLATMHANNSYHALGRILSFYPPESRSSLLADLPAALRSVVSQRLLRTPQGTRRPAIEVLLNSKLISELIERGDFMGVKEAMERALAEGSQTFEADIARMIRAGIVTRDEGLAYADSPANLLWRLENEDGTPPAKSATQAQAEAPSFTSITLDPDEHTTLK
ncbi:MAG: PilT/PilU family type 4a pilus ATPase [Proteobacteria bacterium]|nr:PilT/PilU family type 4a pilus ATPase [Pseudomonadota bacterium]